MEHRRQSGGDKNLQYRRINFFSGATEIGGKFFATERTKYKLGRALPDGGGNGKPIYYIIRRHDPEAGIFSYFIVIAGHLRYALSKGYIPVVDMQNYPNIYLKPELLGKENTWEYYFCQPFGISLEQAYSGENVLLSTGSELSPYPDGSMTFFENRNGSLTEWRMFVKLGLLKLKPELKKEIDDLYNALFSPEDRVLGVLLRGTDYSVRKLFNHFIQPQPEYAAAHVADKLKKWNCNKIFLATEDVTIARGFKNFFGDICIMTNRDYVNYDYQTAAPIGWYHTKRENDYFLRGKDYLTDMGILSKCNSFITGRTCGSMGVMMLAENFENVMAFNLGRYGVATLD